MNLEDRFQVDRLKYSSRIKGTSSEIKERMIQDEMEHQIKNYQEYKNKSKKENCRIPLVGGKYYAKLYLSKKK